MKKKWNGEFPLPGNLLKMLLSVKRGWWCLLAVMCFSLPTTAQTVSLKKRNASLEEILWTLKEKTKFVFAYTTDEIAGIKGIDMDVKDEPVETILDRCLENTGLCWVKENATFVIKPKSLQASLPQYVSRKISGKVCDKAGESLPGVSVVIEGTTTGVVTDVSGNYVISCPEQEGLTLQFSFVGMKSRKVPVDSHSVIDVVMEEDVQEIEEVVVTGIFERKASSFTGSATSMTREQLMRVGNQNLFQSIKNLDPSLMILDNLDAGSNPNALPEMQLRGTSAFPNEEGLVGLKGNYTNNPNLPLFILDGFEASVEKIFDLDMNRVESVTILKDAAAKAIYGSKAANGVVVVETRRMVGGKLQVTYTGSVDISTPDLSSYQLCNAKEKLELEKDYGLFTTTSSYVEDIVRAQELYNRRLAAVKSGIDTDWLSKPLHTGVGHKHNLSFEMGDQNLRLLTDITYNRISGVMKGSDRTNIGGQISISYRYKKVNFRNVLNVTVNDSHDSPYGTFGEYAKMNPYWSPYDESGNLVKNADVVKKDSVTAQEFFPNPLYNSQLNTLLKTEYVDVTDNFYAEWMMIPALKATLRFGVTKKTSSADEFYPANHLKFANYSEEEFFRRGSYQKNEGVQKKLSGDFNINFSKEFASRHYLFANFGMNVGGNTYEEVIYKAEGFPSDRMNDIMFARQYVKDGKPTGNEGKVREMGVLAVVNYSWDDRLLLDASWRSSASSEFGKNNRWGNFWSVGVGWNLNNEIWLKGQEWISQLKVRGSVGYTGSQGFDTYQSMATYFYYLDKMYDSFLGAYLQGMANDELKWQKKLDYNVGIDAYLWDRFSLKFDYYIGVTDNTLVDLSLPTSNGFRSVKENIGKIRNEGLEAKISWTLFSRPQDRTFITLTGAIAHNKNKILKISEALKHHNEEQEKLSQDRFNTKPIVKYYEGVSMNAIWACRSLGIDPANGREMFLDADGMPTYAYNPRNQVVCGNTLPKASGNFGIGGEYKGWGLNIVCRYLFGGQMYNTTLMNKVEGCDINYNVDRRVFDGRWRKPGDKTRYRALARVWVEEEQAYKMEKTNPTSRFVQNRNELDIASITLSYDFYRYPFIRKMGMERLRLSCYMNDVYKYSSIEIERGLDYPFARSFNFSVQATF